MNATAVDIKTMLQTYLDSSSGLTTVYPIFVGKEPATPINTITIFETNVFPQSLTMDRSEIYEYNSVQIRVTSTSYEEGWDMVYAIKNALHGRANETWGNSLYTLIRCSSGPALLDFDKNQRPRFIINFYIQRR